MPAGDGTGPRGEGPFTGRAMGYCSGYPVGGYASAPGRGGGRGGRGWRNRYYDTGLPFARRYQPYREPAPPGGPSETDSLKRQVQFIADALEQIAGRVEQLINRRKAKE